MTEKFKALVSGMDQETLEELRQSVVAEINGRRPGIQIGDIHPRMSATEKEAAAQEIARVLRGPDFGGNDA